MLTVGKARTLLRVSREEGWPGIRRVLARKRRTLSRALLGNGTWGRYSDEASDLASKLDFSQADIAASKLVHECAPGRLNIRSLTWFMPDFGHAYYGGIHTILRFAQYLQDSKGVTSHFVIVGNMGEVRAAQLIGQAFPSLSKATVRQVDFCSQLACLDGTDAGIATLWSTAYLLLRFNTTRRKFYFLQDYEPLFYPAGSIYAQAEATYRFGFYGIANTQTIKRIYEEQHGGVAEFFVPCVDTNLFRPSARRKLDPSEPYQVLFYGRPEHPRNGFELGAAALIRLKHKLGDRVRIVSAGAAWRPCDYGLEGIVENQGLLDYRETGALYRECTAGLVMMFTRHPSYLPLELMASGSLVVSNYNPATTWLLRHRENCLLSEPSASCLADTLEQALLETEERERIVANAAREIQVSHRDWDGQMERVYLYMCDPFVRRE